MVRMSRPFTSDLSEMSAMRAFTSDVCRQGGFAPGDDALDRLQLALTEAAANVIRHAYQGEPGHQLLLAVEAGAERVSLTLYHEGRDFEPKTVPPPSFDGSREGGFGLFLMEQLVDEVLFFRDTQGRRGVRLVQRRPIPVTEARMQLTVETVGDVAVVTPHVEQFDAGNADDFKREIAPVLKEHRKLVLDLSRVQFVDSRGCGAILSCLKTLTESGGDLRLCGINKFVRSVFELIRLHRICEIFETREEAIKAFEGAKK
jgi:anti-anti-sigma factor